MASTTRGRDEPPVLTPRLILYAYAAGIFPMADPDENGRISWYAPDPRAILPLDRFKIPRSLSRTLRAGRFEIRTDTQFESVVRACAAPRENEEGTWISEEMVEAYGHLHRLGHAHSVESYLEGRLVGGLYGVALGSAFFGESMFRVEPDASKVALVHLVRRLLDGGYTLLDIQVLTPHLARFGAIEVPRGVFEELLHAALLRKATWNRR